MHQHNLSLEECLVTTDGWFRLFTMFVGMTVTYTWFIKEFSGEKGKKYDTDESHRRRIVGFAGDLSESLLDMAEDLEKADAVENVAPSMEAVCSEADSIFCL